MDSLLNPSTVVSEPKLTGIDAFFYNSSTLQTAAVLYVNDNTALKGPKFEVREATLQV